MWRARGMGCREYVPVATSSGAPFSTPFFELNLDCVNDSASPFSNSSALRALKSSPSLMM